MGLTLVACGGRVTSSEIPSDAGSDGLRTAADVTPEAGEDRVTTAADVTPEAGEDRVTTAADVTPEAGEDRLTTAADVTPEAGEDRLTTAADVTPEAGEDGIGGCSGLYMPAAPGSLPYGLGCVSASALITCQLATPAVFVSCFQNARSELQCGYSGEHDCANVCAPGEFAALCGDPRNSSRDDGGAFFNPGCRYPDQDVEPLSSVVYFCCACSDE
jgi:hypothetical protein